MVLQKPGVVEVSKFLINMKIISSRKLNADISGDVAVTEENLFLPEELWLEIFRRFPFETVFKFKCVSKRWCYLLTMASKSLTTPVPYSIEKRVSPDFQAFRYDGFSFKFLDSSIFNYDKDNEGTLRLLATSNGLVLFVSQLYLLNNNVRYFVCNPLTKRWDTVPKPLNSRESGRYSFLHGFICTESSSVSSSASTYSPYSSRVSYKVIRMREEHKPTTQFEIEIFASDLGEWNTYSVLSPHELCWGYHYFREFSCDNRSRSRLYTSNVVTTCYDVLYWLEGNSRERIIAYDLSYNKEKYVGHGHSQCRLIDLPEVIDEEDLNYQCLGESEGFLYYSRVEQQKPMSLSIWVLKDKNNSNISEAHEWCWQLVHKIALKDMLPKDKDSGFSNDHEFEGKVIFPLAFHPINRDILILEYFSTCIMEYNMKIRRFEVLHRPESPYYFNPRVRSELPVLVTPSATTIPRIH